MNNPLISIAIPVYNAVKYIEQTIDNFLAQTYPNIEILVQDDRSTDGTWEVLQTKYAADKRVKMERNEKNMGIGPNWNRAYDRATGEYIVIANADDIHEHHFIEKALSDIITYKVDFVTFKYKMLHDNTNESHFTNENIALKSGIVKDPVEETFFTNPYHIIFTLFKRANIEKIKINNKAFLDTQVCDYELILRYARHYKLYFDEESIGYYRIHESNNSGIPLAEQKSFYYDVVPLWHRYLKKRFGYRYRKKHLDNLIIHLKFVVKGMQKFNYGIIAKCIKYYTT